ncbi:hypothetical protein NLU13_5500 [Sarocladium strictum]|uniref:Uncharacterized protein n=1 Tax=Sarocladium strictum TaxID=5046 RepID=A0AA39GH05_SARSR|nr:hypothetical protein NLU13_5500 [Sarocladium strictum]
MDAPISSPSNPSSAASSSVQQSPTTSTIPVPAPTPSTDALLKEFSLVAEAAKRAQVAVMVRDFESFAL